MHLHILGICGTFMGGIAAIAREAGHQVTGSDASVYPPMSTQLDALGIGLTEGYGADQIRIAPDLWIIGNVVTGIFRIGVADGVSLVAWVAHLGGYFAGLVIIGWFDPLSLQSREASSA